MSDTTKHSTRKPFKVDLDSEITALPGRSARSLLEIFLQMERLARRQERDAKAAQCEGGLITPQEFFPKQQNLGANFGAGIHFRELGREVLSAARAQVRTLIGRAQEVQMLVLINDWSAVSRLWSGLLMDCKTPLIELNFLEELWGIRPERLEVNGWSLARLWHEFVLLRAEIEIQLARRQNLVEMSNTLERTLGEWLGHFAELLDKIDDESIA